MNLLSPLGAGLPAQNTLLPDAANRPQPLPTSQAAAPTVAVSAQAVQPTAAAESGKSAGTRPEDLQDAIDKVAKLVAPYNSELEFSIDEDLGVSVVKVIDKTSDEVIRQIPSEDMLKMSKNIDKLIGLFVKQKA